MKKPFTPREAVCQYMGWSYDEAPDYRYHHGMTKTPIYSMSDGYVCALPNGKKVPKADEEYINNYDDDRQFVEATGDIAEYCKSRGKTIWIFFSESK